MSLGINDVALKGNQKKIVITGILDKALEMPPVTGIQLAICFGFHAILGVNPGKLRHGSACRTGGLYNFCIAEALAQIAVDLFRLHISNGRNLPDRRLLHFNFESMQQAVADYQNRQQGNRDEPDGKSLRKRSESHGKGERHVEMNLMAKWSLQVLWI